MKDCVCSVNIQRFYNNGDVARTNYLEFNCKAFKSLLTFSESQKDLSNSVTNHTGK